MPTTSSKFLGREASDKITGFKGLIVGHVSYLTGCDQLLIQPKGSKPSERPQAEWFDENRITVDEKKKPVVLQPVDDRGGPDRPAPTK